MSTNSPGYHLIASTFSAADALCSSASDLHIQVGVDARPNRTSTRGTHTEQPAHQSPIHSSMYRMYTVLPISASKRSVKHPFRKRSVLVMKQRQQKSDAAIHAGAALSRRSANVCGTREPKRKSATKRGGKAKPRSSIFHLSPFGSLPAGLVALCSSWCIPPTPPDVRFD